MGSSGIRLENCYRPRLENIKSYGLDHAVEAVGCHEVEAIDVEAYRSESTIIRAVPELHSVPKEQLDSLLADLPSKKASAVRKLTEGLRPFLDASAKETAKKLVACVFEQVPNGT